MAEAAISYSSGCTVKVRSIRDRRLRVKRRTPRYERPGQDTPLQLFAARLSFFTLRGAVVLIAPFTSVIDLGHATYPYIPVSLLVSDRFESDTKISAAHMPVFVFHTVEDEYHPFEEGRRLYELAGNPKHFEEAHGPHCQHSYPFFLALQQFLSASTGLKVHAPRKWISSVLEETIEAKGLQAGLQEYQELCARHSDEYNFAEYELSQLGQDLLRKGKFADAIAILKLNAEEYPESFNVYDELGDGYLEAGDKQAAEQNFRRSLQVYPGADNYSRKKLDAILTATKSR